MLLEAVLDNPADWLGMGGGFCILGWPGCETSLQEEACQKSVKI